ncbi:hypothetical protein C8Q76DRAFT_704986 [Earliella scabrosa]|nr:hypothetical protein C8Q76DRAFT_704986 [Earliella scabrosa]
MSGLYSAGANWYGCSARKGVEEGGGIVARRKEASTSMSVFVAPVITVPDGARQTDTSRRRNRWRACVAGGGEGAGAGGGGGGVRGVVGDAAVDVRDKDSKSRAAGKMGKMAGFIEYNDRRASPSAHVSCPISDARPDSSPYRHPDTLFRIPFHTGANHAPWGPRRRPAHRRPSVLYPHLSPRPANSQPACSQLTRPPIKREPHPRARRSARSSPTSAHTLRPRIAPGTVLPRAGLLVSAHILYST